MNSRFTSIIVLVLLLLSVVVIAQPPGRTPEATAAQALVNTLQVEIPNLQKVVTSLQAAIDSGAGLSPSEQTSLKSIIAKHKIDITEKYAILNKSNETVRNWQQNVAPVNPATNSHRTWQSANSGTISVKHTSLKGVVDTHMFQVWRLCYGKTIPPFNPVLTKQLVGPRAAPSLNTLPNYGVVDEDGKISHLDLSSLKVTDGTVTISFSIPPP